MDDAHERFYTRAAEKAARKLVAKHREQERAAERARPSGLDPMGEALDKQERRQLLNPEQRQKLRERNQRVRAGGPRGYG